MHPRSLVGLVAPPLCALCSGKADPREPLCRGCAADLASGPSIDIELPGVDAAWAARPYAGAARGLVAALKFASRLALAETAAATIAAAAPPGLLSGTLVPVPPAPVRRALRGFDPAEEIALALARERGLALVRCLARAPGPRQVGRRRPERTGDPPRVRARGQAPAAVLLIDDVTTTGATLRACAAALRSAGARRVIAVAFAAAPAAGLAAPAPLGSGCGAA